jgi:hypothetical protein
MTVNQDNKQARFDDLVGRKCLTPATTGVTITNSPGGTTYDLGIKSATFTYNDAAGYNYVIRSSTAYGKVIATNTVATGDVAITLTDGSAKVNLGATVDLPTNYAGASGATKYIIVLHDDVGKILKGHLGEAVDTTGCVIYSARNGSTQNWDISTVGFNVSADPVTYKIYRDQ